MQTSQLETHITDDGSLTLYHPELKEHFHNRAGAYLESQENYIRPAQIKTLLENKRDVCLIDTCFGLGYNTFSFLQEALKHQNSDTSITIFAIDNNPDLINYFPEVLNDPRFYDLKFLIPMFEHNTYYQTFMDSPCFSIDVVGNGSILIHFFIQDFRLVLQKLKDQKIEANLVLHDPFAPSKVPELWTHNIFELYYALLNEREGKLLTYSLAGAVRGGLKEARFHLYRTPGVGRKNGGTLASITKLPTSHYRKILSAEEETYLNSASGIPYRDSSFQDSRLNILNKRSQEQTCFKEENLLLQM